MGSPGRVRREVNPFGAQFCDVLTVQTRSGQEHLLRTVVTNPCHTQEDDDHHVCRGLKMPAAGSR